MARTKGKSRKWSVVHPWAAGIDIGSQFHVVAVPDDLDSEPASVAVGHGGVRRGDADARARR